MLVPIVFLLVLPVVAAFLSLYQAWLTHAEHGYSAETAGALMLMPWMPLLLGFSFFVVLGAVELSPSFRDALSVGVGLAVLGAAVAAGLTGEVGLGELFGSTGKPWQASGLHIPMVLTTAAMVAALLMVGLADVAVLTVLNVAAAAGAGAAAAGGASFWGGEAFRIPRREVLALATAAAIFAFLVMRFAGL